MARKPGETTADVRARKEKNAKAPKFAPGAAPVKALDKPSNNPPPSSSSGSSSKSSSNSSSSSSSNAAQSFAAGKVNETKNMMSKPSGNRDSWTTAEKRSYKQNRGVTDKFKNSGASQAVMPSPGMNDSSSGALAPWKSAAGYQFDKDAYGQAVRDDINYSPGMVPFDTEFTDEGYLTYDSTRAQGTHEAFLREAGYKVGDMLWKPGTRDELNGRILTGRIKSGPQKDPNDPTKYIGNFHPEYEHEAVNSAFRSTGNPGYSGEVGLGADQYAYNRAFEQNHPSKVKYGQANHQLKENGVSDQGIDDYWQRSNSRDDFIADMRSDNYGSNQSDFAPNPNTANVTPVENNYNNYDWEAQMSAAQNKINPYKSNNTPSYSSSMNFNFDPYKFQQGQ